jgi:hypothetical protein
MDYDPHQLLESISIAAVATLGTAESGGASTKATPDNPA